MSKDPHSFDIAKVKKVSYYKDFWDMMERTHFFREFNDHSVIEFEGELYQITMYANPLISGCTVKHIKTHTIAFAEDKQMGDQRYNPVIWQKCYYLARKFWDTAIEETEKLFKEADSKRD